MLRLLRNKKGQNTAEYAILIGLVVAGVIGMQTYVKRGIQGQFKDASNDFYGEIADNNKWKDAQGNPIGKPDVAALAKPQYEPEYLSSQSTQKIITDTETATLNKEGTTSRSFERTTQQADGDFQKSDN